MSYTCNYTFMIILIKLPSKKGKFVHIWYILYKLLAFCSTWLIIDDLIYIPVLQEYWTCKTVELTDPAALNQSLFLPQPSCILVLLQPSCTLAAAFPHTFSSLAAALLHTFHDLSWKVCGKSAGRLRQVCGRAATDLREGCGKSAGRLRQVCGRAATGLQEGCDKSAADSSSWIFIAKQDWKSMRQGCRKSAARANLHVKLMTVCGKSVAGLPQKYAASKFLSYG